VSCHIEDSKKAIDYLYQATQQVIDHKNSSPSMIEVILFFNKTCHIRRESMWRSIMRHNIFQE
jgi:hypothetical protein